MGAVQTIRTSIFKFFFHGYRLLEVFVSAQPTKSGKGDQR